MIDLITDHLHTLMKPSWHFLLRHTFFSALQHLLGRRLLVPSSFCRRVGFEDFLLSALLRTLCLAGNILIQFYLALRALYGRSFACVACFPCSDDWRAGRVKQKIVQYCYASRRSVSLVHRLNCIKIGTSSLASQSNTLSCKTHHLGIDSVSKKEVGRDLRRRK